MRILYTVQRYGESIVGGSENACRAFAENLVAVGHQVEVITSCATDYRTWENELAPGTSVLNGVTVHRLPVTSPRTESEFSPYQRRTFFGPRPISTEFQRTWAEVMGPSLQGYPEWLLQNYSRFDVAVCMTYLYYTTTAALPVLYQRLPLVMQPTAHNESEIWLSLFDFLFSMPDGFLFLTPEEQNLVRKRFKAEPRGQVVGIGFQQSSTEISTSSLTAHALQPFEYLVYVGRNDSAKGLPLLIDYFLAYKAKNNSELKLLIVGEDPKQQDDSDSIIYTGYVTESEKLSLIHSSLALVQPSYFESFSIVLCEAWSQKRPVLVQEKNDVLVGQTQRANGGLIFSTYSDFEIAVNYLLSHPEESAQMGAWGHDYVNELYTWESVISKTEVVLSDAVDNFNRVKNSAT